MLRVIGYTEDKKIVLGGVYEVHETHGVPICMIIDAILKSGRLVSYYDFMLTAYSKIKSPKKIGKIKSLLSEAVQDAQMISDFNKKIILKKIEDFQFS